MSNDISTDAMTDQDGFLVDSREWNKNVAFEFASAEGITELTDQHWDVISQLRKANEATAAEALPQLKSVCDELGMKQDCVTELFGDPIVAWRIAGLPKPTTEMISAYMPTSQQG